MQARVERHTGVGCELVQALDVRVLHRMEVADDINDRATLQLHRGLAVPPERVSERIVDTAPGVPFGSSFGVQVVSQERLQRRSVEQVSSSGVQLAPLERVLQRSEQIGGSASGFRVGCS